MKNETDDMEPPLDDLSALTFEHIQKTTYFVRIASRENPVRKRLFWVLLLAMCYGASFYYLAHALLTYLSYPVITKTIRTSNPELDFPSVTICNYNWITSSYLAERNDSLLNRSMRYLSDPLRTPAEDPELVAYMRGLDDPLGIVLDGTHNVNDTFLVCWFPGVDSGGYDACDLPEGLIEQSKTQMGLCNTFQPASYVDAHGGERLKARRAGSLGGLSMMIDIQHDEYEIGYGPAGIKVLAHDPHTKPNIWEMGVAVQPGVIADIIIDKQELVALPYPYVPRNASCLDTSATDYVNPLAWHDTYSVAACTEEEVVNYTLKVCGCIHFLLSGPPEKYCTLYDLTACAIPATADFFYNNSEARTNCPKPCHELWYDMRVSTAMFPNNKLLSQPDTFYNRGTRYFSQNVISLAVYYGDMSETKTEQIPAYQASNFLADLGGLAGLWLGASVLTVCECLEFMAELAHCLLRKCGRTRAKTRRINVQP